MKDENKNENAKNRNFRVPVDLPGAKPEDYDASIDSGYGSAGQQKPKGQVPAPEKQHDPDEKDQKPPLHDEANDGT